MTNFGKLTTFDVVNGVGIIQPETGGKTLRFERSALNWPRQAPPATNQPLSYEASTDEHGKACAINLQPA